MSVEPNKSAPCYLSLTISAASSGPDGIPLDVPDIRRIPGIGALLLALPSYFGGPERVAVRLLAAEIRICPRVDSDLPGLEHSSVEHFSSQVRDLHDNANKLRLNSDLSEPAALGSVVTNEKALASLTALQKANASSNLVVCFVHNGADQPLPALESKDLSSTRDPARAKKSGSFEIVGLRRDDAGGHILLITKDNLFLRLPRDEAWAWKNIRDCLECSSRIEATIRRGVGGWMLEGDAKLHKQPPILEEAASAGDS